MKRAEPVLMKSPRGVARSYNTCMRAEILTIGSELTSGVTVNTNAAYLGRCLAEVGIVCDRQTTVSDKQQFLRQAILEALKRSNVLILTGGLGPTFDDVTIEVLAQAIKHPLQLAPQAAAAIRRFYVKHRRPLQQAALRQAYLPRNAIALPNPIGTAPGVWLKTGRHIIVALPGVPSEMRAIMSSSILPRLRKLQSSRVILGRTLRTIGLVELEIQNLLEHITIPKAIEIGLYPSLRLVDVRLTISSTSKKKAQAGLKPVESALRRKLGNAVYGTGSNTFEEAVAALLIRKNLTLAVAESCTGGLITDRLTNVPGSSAFLLGGIVAYHNDLKKKSLKVPAQLLSRHGAVSLEVAQAMAEGVRRLAKADIGIAVTGIAGPTGGTKNKPVGLVCFGLSCKQQQLAQKHQFTGDRLSIKTQAAQTALNWLRCYVLEAFPAKGNSSKNS